MGTLPIDEYKQAVYQMLTHYPNGLSIQELTTKTSLTTNQVIMAISTLSTECKIGSIPVPVHKSMRYQIKHFDFVDQKQET